MRRGKIGKSGRNKQPVVVRRIPFVFNRHFTVRRRDPHAEKGTGRRRRAAKNEVGKFCDLRNGCRVYLPGWLFYYKVDSIRHAPVSNLFEFTTFFGMMLVGAFMVIYFLYRSAVLGLFALAGCASFDCLCKHVPERHQSARAVS